jgi:S1-C subfamily serine protease
MISRVSRRTVFLISIFATAISFFTLGLTGARLSDAAARDSFQATLEAIRTEVKSQLGQGRGEPWAAGTAGHLAANEASASARAEMVATIKDQLQSEMGLVPLQLLRDRRSSFVELYSYDSLGKTNYGTAGYLGGGYFITVKHAVVALAEEGEASAGRKITSIKVVYQGKEIPAKVVDTGDAEAEVHSGDWAIIKTRDLDLPALHADTDYAYDFADPIFRLGNDYSKGIIVSTGYVGQRTANGLITCLTDGHPGVSGGGVLDQRGNLVGIPVGRMQGDYRFSFILPLRAEMFRKVPRPEVMPPAAAVVAATTH